MPPPSASSLNSQVKLARSQPEVEVGKRKDAESDLGWTPDCRDCAQLKHQAYLLASASDAIIELNGREDTVLYWNHGAERLYGWTTAEAMGKNIHALLKTVFPTPLNEMKATLESQGHWLGELIHTKRDGTQVFVASHCTLGRERGSGGPATWLEINRDISERKKVEENLRQLSVTLLHAQDEERRKIARELHDNVDQYLTAILMSLEGVRRNPSAHGKLDDAVEAARSCMAEIRTISHLLHPPLLEELGLGSAISHYVAGFAARSGIAVHAEVPDGFRKFDNKTEIVLFRIVQESLTNIHRHSGSKSATIRTSVDPDNISLEVQDHGKGSMNAINGDRSGPFRAGVGITGMQERVRELGGTLEITADQNGTHVKAVVPLVAESRKTKGDEKALSAVG